MGTELPVFDYGPTDLGVPVPWVCEDVEIRRKSGTRYLVLRVRFTGMGNLTTTARRARRGDWLGNEGEREPQMDADGRGWEERGHSRGRLWHTGEGGDGRAVETHGRVMLSEAKHLGADPASACRAEILRYAQDDTKAFLAQTSGHAGEMRGMTDPRPSRRIDYPIIRVHPRSSAVAVLERLGERRE